MQSVWQRSIQSTVPFSSNIEPDANCDFIFRFEGESSDAVSAVFAGFDSVAVPFTAEAGLFTYVGIQLQPWVTSAMIGTEMENCVNGRLPLRDLITSVHFTSLLKTARKILQTEKAKPTQLLPFLTPVIEKQRYDPLMHELFETLKKRADLSVITEIADDQGYSIRTLERRCLRTTGLPPRELVRIFRFLHARRHYRPGRSLADLALKSGYSDQAHLSREFRRIAGNPPSAYFSR